MVTFAQAVRGHNVRTEKGMKAHADSGNPVVDLFYNIGAMRGQDPTRLFDAAYHHDKNLALRVALWSRDVRQGAGERDLFRAIVRHLETIDLDSCRKLLARVHELGRFDDLFVVQDNARQYALELYAQALRAGNGLAAKWAPRKGRDAADLRRAMDLTPKQYRKLIVRLSKTVEQQMCARDWDNINFSHVPSAASQLYKKAFGRHTLKYAAYLEALKTGKDENGNAVKVNASAIYPYDVIKDLFSYGSNGDRRLIEAQWNALPNYVGDSSVMPIIDVSGSMSSPISVKTKVTCMQAAVSTGLYVADKNTGVFKDTFLTFSDKPQLVHVTGSIVDKVAKTVRADWGGTTNLHAAFEKILSTAVKARVPVANMPKILLILSDMQFDHCAQYDDSAIQMIGRKYEAAGYQMPKVVFWNFRSTDNTPVQYNDRGVALVSGFSPSILKAVLSDKLDTFSPENVMLQTITSDRYNY